jgi:DnaJ family protein B protein 4
VLGLFQHASTERCSDFSVQVTVSDVARPDTEKRVKGEGMPVSKSPGMKGDLRIRFDVEFPRSLTDQQKQALRQILPSG